MDISLDGLFDIDGEREEVEETKEIEKIPEGDPYKFETIRCAVNPRSPHCAIWQQIEFLIKKSKTAVNWYVTKF